MRKRKTACSRDGSVGRQVALATVKALVRDDQASRLEEREWYFCNEPGCDVVYFSDDGRQITRAALKVRVGIKEKDAPRIVCYCFGHTVESIGEEIDRTGHSTVVDTVAAKVEAGDCQCEILNPEGICCLGELSRTVKEARADLHTTEDSSPNCRSSPVKKPGTA